MKPEQERVKNLLTDTVTLLCKNGLNFNKELKVQGLLGITLDGSDVFIVHINEKCGGEIVAVRADDGDEDLAALGLTYPRDTASPNLSRVKNRKSASTTSKHHGSDSPSAQTHSPKERVRLKRSNNTAEGSSQEPIQIKAEPDDDMFSSSCEKQGELDSRLAPDQPIGDSSGFGADFSQSLKHDPGDQDSNHGDSQENDTGPPTAKRKPPSSLSSARGSTSSDTTTTPFITGIIRNSVTDKTEPISGNAGSGEMGPLNQDSQVVVDSAPSWDASSESQGSQGISQTAESTAQDTFGAMAGGPSLVHYGTRLRRDPHFSRKPFRCIYPLCGKMFYRRSELNRHQKSKHGLGFVPRHRQYIGGRGGSAAPFNRHPVPRGGVGIHGNNWEPQVQFSPPTLGTSATAAGGAAASSEQWNLDVLNVAVHSWIPDPETVVLQGEVDLTDDFQD